MISDDFDFDIVNFPFLDGDVPHENGPRALSAPALELNTIIFKHVYWYMQQISGESLQDHWSSGYDWGSYEVIGDHIKECACHQFFSHIGYEPQLPFTSPVLCKMPCSRT